MTISTSTPIDDRMRETMIQRSLFGVGDNDCSSRVKVVVASNSLLSPSIESSLEGGVASPFSANPKEKPVEALLPTTATASKKRKHTSSETEDPSESEDCVSLPSLEFENEDIIVDDDERSELDDRSLSSGNDDEQQKVVPTTFDGSEEETLERNRKKRKNTKGTLSDLIVVLDMDECLIHFRPQDEQTENEAEQGGSTTTSTTTGKENHHNLGEGKQPGGDENKKSDPPIVIDVDGNEVLLRPGLVAFLEFVTERFQTHIFTAGTKDYADPILDHLSRLVMKNNNKNNNNDDDDDNDHHNDDDDDDDTQQDVFCKRWYRDDCDTIEIIDPMTQYCIDNIYVKPLSKVAQWAGRDSQDLERIVHIDDQPRNFLLNHGNGIKVPEWKGDNRSDDVLSDVTKILEKMDTESFGDVRPHLRAESYRALKDPLDMMHLFPYRRTKGIGPSLL